VLVLVHLQPDKTGNQDAEHQQHEHVSHDQPELELAVFSLRILETGGRTTYTE
jgi:hypothetical protein